MNHKRLAKLYRELAEVHEDAAREDVATPEPAKSEVRIKVTELDLAKARRALRRIGEKV